MPSVVLASGPDRYLVPNLQHRGGKSESRCACSPWCEKPEAQTTTPLEPFGSG